MPLSAQELIDIRAEAFAEDVEITPDMHSWDEEKAIAYFQNGGTSTPPPPPLPPPPLRAVSTYRVIHPFVNVRSDPALNATVLGKKSTNDRVIAEALGGRDNAWIKLEERFDGRVGWLLIDGASIGLGRLLELESGPLPLTETILSKVASAQSEGGVGASVQDTAASAKRLDPGELLAPMTFEVVHSFVRVRKEPSASSAELGMKRKGTLVSVDARKGDWVRLEREPMLMPILPIGSLPPATSGNESTTSVARGDRGGAGGAGGGGWMLTNGREMKPQLGALLQPHIIHHPAGTRWQLTREGGKLKGYSNPGGQVGGDHAESLDGYACGAEFAVVAECGLWVQVQVDGRHLWVEMDAFLAG